MKNCGCSFAVKGTSVSYHLIKQCRHFHRVALYANHSERVNKLFPQPDIISTRIDEVTLNAKPVVLQIRKLPKRIQNLLAKIPHQEVCTECLFIHLSTHWMLLSMLIDFFGVNTVFYLIDASCLLR